MAATRCSRRATSARLTRCIRAIMGGAGSVAFAVTSP
jgi:hypothetical protein